MLRFPLVFHRFDAGNGLRVQRARTRHLRQAQRSSLHTLRDSSAVETVYYCHNSFPSLSLSLVSSGMLRGTSLLLFMACTQTDTIRALMMTNVFSRLLWVESQAPGATILAPRNDIEENMDGGGSGGTGDTGDSVDSASSVGAGSIEKVRHTWWGVEGMEFL